MQYNLPLVSVLTPTLNSMGYLEDSIQSVLTQDYDNLEHVIADGGSTDGTYEYLLELAKSFPQKIKVLPSKVDNGVGSALNRALNFSEGSLIRWLDSDDLLAPGSISYGVDFFSRNPDKFFIYGECKIIDEKSLPIGNFVIRDFDKWEWINRWHYIVFSSIMFRRQVTEEVGFLNDLGNDLDFYLRTSTKFSLQRVDYEMSSWRLHKSSISLRQNNQAEKIRKERLKQDFYIILKYHGSIFSPKAINYLNLIGGNIYAKLPNFLLVFSPIAKYIKHRVFIPILNSHNHISAKSSFTKIALIALTNSIIEKHESILEKFQNMLYQIKRKALN
jgi:glycosyltransferase involved in cell wall biosynthesis